MGFGFFSKTVIPGVEMVDPCLKRKSENSFLVHVKRRLPHVVHHVKHLHFFPFALPFLLVEQPCSNMIMAITKNIRRNIDTFADRSFCGIQPFVYLGFYILNDYTRLTFN